MKVYPDLMKVMRAGARINRQSLRKQNDSGFIVGLCIFVGVLVLGVALAFGQDKCQDPSTLSPQLKKAYYELKKASTELGGFSVSIKCYPTKG